MSGGDGSPVFESRLAVEAARIHAAAVYCSDGRVGEQFDDFMQNGLRLPRYDRLAIPGGPACLAGHWASYWEARGVEEQLRFLIAVHDLERVVLIAHEGCAYYRERLKSPSDTVVATQRRDLEKAARAVKALDSRVSVSTFYAGWKDEGVAFWPVEP